MINHILRGVGHHVGVTSTDGIYIDNRLVKQVDASGPRSAQLVLQNPRVDCAVFEVARGGILREGLGYQRNDVAVVLNVTGDHLGLKEVHTLRQLAAIKRVIVEAVPRSGTAVLNADDELVADMRSHCSGSVILFSMQPDNELVERWVRRGGKAVTVKPDPPRGEMILIQEGRRTTSMTWVHLLPSTFNGYARMNVQNALAAAAAAHAAGVHLHDIRQGLRTFHTSFYEAPGRLNLFELQGIRVVVDYAHNPHGLAMVGDFVQRLRSAADGDRPGRRIAVVATPGDRRDEDIREVGQVAARYFEQVIVREDYNLRGRPRGESADLVMQGIQSAKERGSPVEAEVILEEMSSVRAAIDHARRGDLVLLCVDRPAEVWRYLEARGAEAAAPTS